MDRVDSRLASMVVLNRSKPAGEKLQVSHVPSGHRRIAGNVFSLISSPLPLAGLLHLRSQFRRHAVLGLGESLLGGQCLEFHLQVVIYILRDKKFCTSGPRSAASNDRLEILTIHHGRHTFISHALAGGRTLAGVRDAAGHSNVTVTSGYLHVAVEDDGIGALFG